MKLKLVNSEIVVSEKGEHMELWTMQSVLKKNDAETIRKKMGEAYELETKP